VSRKHTFLRRRPVKQPTSPRPSAIPAFIRKMCVDKVRYRLESDALAMLSVICGQRNGRPGRVYQCVHCDGFHITSRLRASQDKG
jgi:hypothetical protein